MGGQRRRRDVDVDPADKADFEAAWLTRDAIERALEGLPPELRLAVTLRDVHGLEYREIAATTGVPMGTVSRGSSAPASASAWRWRPRR